MLKVPGRLVWLDRNRESSPNYIWNQVSLQIFLSAVSWCWLAWLAIKYIPGTMLTIQPLLDVALVMIWPWVEITQAYNTGSELWLLQNQWCCPEEYSFNILQDPTTNEWYDQSKARLTRDIVIDSQNCVSIFYFPRMFALQANCFIGKILILMSAEVR